MPTSPPTRTRKWAKKNFSLKIFFSRTETGRVKNTFLKKSSYPEPKEIKRTNSIEHLLMASPCDLNFAVLALRLLRYKKFKF
jgi:hypothetical protein